MKKHHGHPAATSHQVTQKIFTSPSRHSQPDERKDASPWKCFILPKCKTKLGESSWSCRAERKIWWGNTGIHWAARKKGMIRMCFFVRFFSEASQSGKKYIPLEGIGFLKN